MSKIGTAPLGTQKLGSSSLKAPSITDVDFNASTNTLDVYWNDNSAGEDGFNIYIKKENDSSFSKDGSVGENTTSYTSTSLADSPTYNVKVEAYTSFDTAESNVFTVATSALTTIGSGLFSFSAAATTTTGRLQTTGNGSFVFNEASSTTGTLTQIDILGSPSIVDTSVGTTGLGTIIGSNSVSLIESARAFTDEVISSVGFSSFILELYGSAQSELITLEIDSPTLLLEKSYSFSGEVLGFTSTVTPIFSDLSTSVENMDVTSVASIAQIDGTGVGDVFTTLTAAGFPAIVEQDIGVPEAAVFTEDSLLDIQESSISYENALLKTIGKPDLTSSSISGESGLIEVAGTLDLIEFGVAEWETQPLKGEASVVATERSIADEQMGVTHFYTSINVTEVPFSTTEADLTAGAVVSLVDSVTKSISFSVPLTGDIDARYGGTDDEIEYLNQSDNIRYEDQ